MEIKPTEFAWIIAMVTAVSTLTGVIISSTFSYFNARATRKSEESRHLKEIVINAAIESWKLQIEAYKIHQQKTSIVPLDAYIIHMIKFADVILTEELQNQT